MKQISKKREKGRHKASAHTEVCFLWVCVCLWIHSLPQSPNERPELPPSPSLQSLLHPSCSPPALLSLFITIWTIVCRLLSLSLSQCCSFSPLSLSLSLSLSYKHHVIFLALWSLSISLHPAPLPCPTTAHSPWGCLPPCSHTELFFQCSPLLHAILPH